MAGMLTALGQWVFLVEWTFTFGTPFHPSNPLPAPGPTWYVPCGFAITDVPSPKVVQHLLSSQLVMTVA